MTKRRFVCTLCGYRFEKEVFEKGEAKEKKVQTVPVTCPRCDGPVARA
jgi:transposase-like protein